MTVGSKVKFLQGTQLMYVFFKNLAILLWRPEERVYFRWPLVEVDLSARHYAVVCAIDVHTMIFTVVFLFQAASSQRGFRSILVWLMAAPGPTLAGFTGVRFG